MGYQEAAGQGGMLQDAAGRWAPSAAARGLAREAASWTSCPCDAQRSRQFLANFAFDLVQLFRSEEVRLKQVRSPLLAGRRRENQHLAWELRELMREADLGRDVTAGIQAFLEDWRSHQARSPLLGVASQAATH